MPATALKAPALRTGVYLDHNRHTAIVVRVDNRRVVFVTMLSGSIELMQVGIERFLKDWVLFLPTYSPIKAARSYATSGLTCTEEANKVLRLLLRNNKV